MMPHFYVYPPQGVRPLGASAAQEVLGRCLDVLEGSAQSPCREGFFIGHYLLLVTLQGGWTATEERCEGLVQNPQYQVKARIYFEKSQKKLFLLLSSV